MRSPYFGIGGILLLVVGPLWSLPAGQPQLGVDALWARSDSAVSRAVLRLESTTAGESTAIEVPLEVPGRVEVTVPTAGTWRARLVCEGYWGETKEVAAGHAAGSLVSLRLFPAARLQSKLVVPAEGKPPEAVSVEFSEAPWPTHSDTAPIPEGSAACEVMESEATCSVPAGKLDLGFHAAGYAPVYRWGVEAAAGKAARLPALQLLIGGSVVGWVQDAESGGPLKGVAARLAPAVSAELDDPTLVQRLERQRFEATTDERGFFQITGVAEGTYQLVVVHEGFAEARPAELIVIGDGGEQRLAEVVSMTRPSLLEITFQPLLDPFGEPWEVEIFRMHENHEIDERFKAPAAPDGSWRRPGLEPGIYRLQVRDVDGSLWFAEEIHLSQASEQRFLEIPRIEVVGTVTRGGKAVPGTLALTGEKASLQFTIDGEGEFEGFLPEEERFHVTLAPDETSRGTRLVLEPVEVERREGSSHATLDIKVPDTRFEGDVVDSDGRPVAGARVGAVQMDKRQSNSTLTDDEGTFELWGIPAGDLLVGASTATGESDKTVLHLVEGDVAPRLRLVIFENVEISGQVHTAGAPVAGAHLLVWPDLGSSYGFSLGDVGTDVDGTFRTSVRATTGWANIMVQAPGFATRILREPIGSDRPLLIELSKDGGNLLLQLPSPKASGRPAAAPGAPRQPTPLLFHNGIFIPAPVFRMLSLTARRSEVALGYLVLGNFESGEYSLCVGAEAFEAFRQGSQPSAAVCQSGFLAARSELLLNTLPAESALP